MKLSEKTRTIQRIVGAAPDGDYGLETATRTLQKMVGATVDGRYGAETATKILRSLGETEPDRQEPPMPQPPDLIVPSKPLKTRVYTAEVEQELSALWYACRITTTDGRFDWYLARMKANRARYEQVCGNVNPALPWWFVGVIHGLEASFSFSKHLHNGDPLQARTVLVPRGRPVKGNPPFTWDESAVDALTMTGKAYDRETDWSIPRCLWRLEGFNGYGYRPQGIHTPYLWAGTNHYTKGKFIADHKYSPTAVSKQAGAAGVIKLLGINL